MKPATDNPTAFATPAPTSQSIPCPVCVAPGRDCAYCGGDTVTTADHVTATRRALTSRVWSAMSAMKAETDAERKAA